MERPIFQPVGTPMEELDTPALVVDIDLMDRNIRTYQGYFLAPDNQAQAKARPVMTSHLCPQIGRRQLAAGGTVGGVTVTTLGEAQVFADAGFDDILLANQVVTAGKTQRLCALAAQVKMSVAIDSPANAEQLSQAAAAAGVELGVLVEIEAGMGRCGVSPGADANALAKMVHGLPGLRLDGIMATVPGPKGSGPAEHREDTRRKLQVALDARESMEQAGLPVAVLSVGGAHCGTVVGDLPGITEVRAGRYPLMDDRLKEHLPELEQAAHVLATVISHPVDSMAVLDAGHKATGPDHGVPVLRGPSDAAATRFSAEHGVVDLTGDAQRRFNPGDKAWLVPYELAACVNQYDYIRAVKDGKLEGFWPLSARGRFA